MNKNNFKQKTSSFSSFNNTQPFGNMIHCKKLSLLIVPQKKNRIQSFLITKERRYIPLIKHHDKDILNTTIEEEQLEIEGKRILSKLSNCIKETNQGEIIIDSQNLIFKDKHQSLKRIRNTSLGHGKTMITPTITEESFVPNKRKWKMSPIRQSDNEKCFLRTNYQNYKGYITNNNHNVNHYKKNNNNSCLYKFNQKMKVHLYISYL